MIKRLKYILLLVAISFSSWGVAQENTLRNDVIQQRIEFIAQQFESSTIDYSNLIEVLTFYFNNPLNINIATKEELESLNLLSPFQIRALITYRIKNGDLLTLYELRNLNGFDFVTIQNLVPFIAVSPSKNADNLNIKRALKFGNNEVMALWGSTLEDQQGYAPRDSNTSEIAGIWATQIGYTYGTNSDTAQNFLLASQPKKTQEKNFLRGATQMVLIFIRLICLPLTWEL